MLSSVFPWHFLDADVLRQIIGLLSISNPDPAVAPLALSVLTYVGKPQPLGDAFPDLMATLVSAYSKLVLVWKMNLSLCNSNT